MEDQGKMDEATVVGSVESNLPKNGRKSAEARSAPASENDSVNPKQAPLARVRGGPRTPMGKERSRRNAVKHGILARTAVLEDESRAEFNSLLQGLRNDFQPSGMLENLLVEKLASLAWRYRRMLVTEQAEIRMGVRFKTAERERRDSQEALTLFSLMKRPGPGLLSKWDNPVIRKHCIGMVETLRTFVETRGLNWDKDIFLIKMIFGEADVSSLVNLYALYHPSGGVPREEGKAKFLEFLSEYISKLKQLSEFTEDQSARERRRSKEYSGVPEATRLDRILRYEAALERGFDRTLNQLERLQRMRLGQPVPAPISVNISNS